MSGRGGGAGDGAVGQGARYAAGISTEMEVGLGEVRLY